MDKYKEALKALIRLMDIEVEDQDDCCFVSSYGVDCEIYNKDVRALLVDVFKELADEDDNKD